MNINLSIRNIDSEWDVTLHRDIERLSRTLNLNTLVYAKRLI